MEVRPVFHWTEERIKGTLRNMLSILPFGKNVRVEIKREEYRVFY
jgi:hypothetical protein